MPTKGGIASAQGRVWIRPFIFSDQIGCDRQDTRHLPCDMTGTDSHKKDFIQHKLLKQ